jgi:hypothetical protein
VKVAFSDGLYHSSCSFSNIKGLGASLPKLKSASSSEEIYIVAGACRDVEMGHISEERKELRLTAG